MDAFLGPLRLVIHFILTECRAVIVFYLSYQSFVYMPVLWYFKHVTLDLDKERAIRGLDSKSPIPLGYFLECLTADFEEMALQPRFGTHTSTCMAASTESDISSQLAHLGPQFIETHLLVCLANYVGLAIVLVFVGVLICHLVSFGPRHFGSGRYIAFTLHIRSHVSYKACALMLVVFNVMMVLALVVMTWRVYVNKGTTVTLDFVAQFAGTLGGIAYSGISFFLPEPSVDAIFVSEEFQAMTLKRSWSTVLTDNVSFCHQLDHISLISVVSNDDELLDAYCEQGGNYTSPTEIVALVKKKDALKNTELRPLLSLPKDEEIEKA